MGFYFDKDGYPHIWRMTFSAVVAIIVAVVLVWSLTLATAHIRGKADAYRQTETGNYQIANYELFKNECNSIVAQDVKIQNAQDALDTDTKAKVDSFTLERDRQNVLALKNIRADLITTYNSDASKSTTKAKFKDAGLPSYISPNAEIGSISCPSQ